MCTEKRLILLEIVFGKSLKLKSRGLDSWRWGWKQQKIPRDGRFLKFKYFLGRSRRGKCFSLTANARVMWSAPLGWASHGRPMLVQKVGSTVFLFIFRFFAFSTSSSPSLLQKLKSTMNHTRLHEIPQKNHTRLHKGCGEQAIPIATAQTPRPCSGRHRPAAGVLLASPSRVLRFVCVVVKVGV